MKEKVLVVQEDLTLRKVIKNMFIQKGYEVWDIPSLNYLDTGELEHHFKIVVSDILFQGVSPLEFVVQIEEVLHFEKIFIVTSLGQEKIKRNVSRLRSVHGYFDFPIDLTQLETKV